MRRLLRSTAAIVALAAVPMAWPAMAAAPPQAVELESWDASQIEAGWSAEALLDYTVFGANGEEVGEVEDILVGPGGAVEAVIVETDAFLDIGDVHARVAWEKVSSGPEPYSVSVPMSEETLEDFRIDYDGRDPDRSWRVREFIGDVVALKDAPSYGVVDDVVFGDDGDIVSVMVRPNYGYGYAGGMYAYPYYGADYGWRPGLGYYNLPYSSGDIRDYESYPYRPGAPF